MKLALLGVQAAGNSLENERCCTGWWPWIIEIAGEPLFVLFSAALFSSIESQLLTSRSQRKPRFHQEKRLVSPILQLSIGRLAPWRRHPTVATMHREAALISARARQIGPTSPNCIQNLVLDTSGGGWHGDK